MCSKLTYQSADPLPPGRDRSSYWAIRRHNLVTRYSGGRQQFGEAVGPLCIKTILQGQEVFETDGVRRAVEPGRYLVLNDGQRYTSSIETDEPVEGFYVWFRPGFAEAAAVARLRAEEKLLDEPQSTASPVVFVDRLYPRDDLVTPIVDRMRHAFDEGWSTREWLDEQFHLLADALLLSHRHETARIERVQAVRKSTRLETYRRLHRAKDYLDSNLSATVPLSEVASVAWLSPHHFLRQFQQLFGESPRQYQTRRRMEKARDLLLRTETPVTDICFSLGFESLGSFSWLFRRLHGAAPSQFRAAYRASPDENGKREEASTFESL